jgi:DNA-binding NtrC family response regulator
MSRPTVLIVDDEPLSRWSASETLTDAGYRVAEAGDAASALRAMRARDTLADVVLLDLLLPDADDLKVLSAMRELAPGSPIILMTSYGSPELFAEARERGAFMSVNKPFEMSDLPDLVARALAARKPLVYFA